MSPTGGRRRLQRTRKVITWVLIVLIAILVPISVETAWAVSTITNTDQYVNTLAPLVRDKVVTAHVSERATDKIFDATNVQERIESALPKRAKFLAAPLTTQLHQFVRTQINKILNSEWFHKLWDRVNRQSHTRVINFLQGKSTPAARAHNLVVDLTPVITKALDALDARGVTTFDGVRTELKKANTLTFNLATSRQIDKARRAFRLATDLGWAVPLITGILIVIAVAIAVDRRKTLLRIAVASAIFALVNLAGLALARNFFVDHAVQVNPTVTRDVFNTLMRYLVDGLRITVVVAAALAVVLWLAGPSTWARWLRAQVVRAARWVGRRGRELTSEHNRRQATAGARRGATWALEHASGLRLAGVIVAGAIIVFGGNLSVSGVWWTTVALAIYLVILELVFAWARRAATSSPTSDTEAKT